MAGKGIDLDKAGIDRRNGAGALGITRSTMSRRQRTEELDLVGPSMPEPLL